MTWTHFLMGFVLGVFFMVLLATNRWVFYWLTKNFLHFWKENEISAKRYSELSADALRKRADFEKKLGEL